MTVANESKEAFRDLQAHGALRGIDAIVYLLLTKQARAMDAREAHNVFKQQGHPLGADMKYNDVQQAFTRLYDKGKLTKLGTHKNPITGRKTGIYRIRREEDKLAVDMFMENGSLTEHEMAKK